MNSKFAGGNFPKAYLDGRNDLGYGRSDPKFHVHKKRANTFPYVEDEVEDLEDVEIDDETIEAVLQKSLSPRKYDHAGGHYDPFYFVAGNTKLGESQHPKGISPFPRMYKKRGPSIGGSSSPGKLNRQFGFRDDIFVPGELILQQYLSTEDEEEIYNLEDVSNKQLEKDLREWISLEILRMI